MAARPRSITARITTAGLLPLMCSVALAEPASAKTQPINYQCQASAVGNTGNFTQRLDIDGSAPATVRRGSPVRVLVTPAPKQLPGAVSGYRIRDIRDLTFTVALPTNADYVSAALAGGSGLGSTPTVTRRRGDVSINVPGPIRGGAQFQLPRLTMNVRARNAGVVVTKLGGNNYPNPGLGFTANVEVGSSVVPVKVACYPDPNPALTTTRIT